MARSVSQRSGKSENVKYFEIDCVYRDTFRADADFARGWQGVGPVDDHRSLFGQTARIGRPK